MSASEDLYTKFKRNREYRKEYAESLWKEGANIRGTFFKEEFYEKIRNETRNWQDITRDYANAAVLIPVGTWAFSEAISFPDFDISMLGIGNHRFFLFHSAAAAWALKTLYEANFDTIPEEESLANRVIRKIFGVAAASSAFAIGCHLTIDVFQPKSVVFPGIGTLVNGTLVDDNVWLFGNAVYCFKVANHLYALALGDDYQRVKGFVKDHFIEPFLVLNK